LPTAIAPSISWNRGSRIADASLSASPSSLETSSDTEPRHALSAGRFPARRPASGRTRSKSSTFQDFDGAKAARLWLPPGDSTFPIESIDWRGISVQYPVWYPENFGHLQTSM
jgi:hypothetical protein